MTRKLEILGLIELTSKRQANNGTLRFHDPITSCDYFSYASGYVRRKPRNTVIYQLNKKITVKRESQYRAGTFFECYERVMEMSEEKRIDIIARATVNFRKYLNK
jgi:hypothetical protein